MVLGLQREKLSKIFDDCNIGHAKQHGLREAAYDRLLLRKGGGFVVCLVI